MSEVILSLIVNQHLFGGGGLIGHEEEDCQGDLEEQDVHSIDECEDGEGDEEFLDADIVTDG